MPDNSTSIKLFVSYSHDDDPYFKVFSEGLKKVIKNTEHFDWTVWDDRNIHIGTFWDDEIQNNLKDCNVAMLLVSVGFMASKYIKEREYNEFIKLYNEKGILIVPIVFAPCDFDRWEDLSRLQFYKPKGALYGKPEIDDFTYADLIKYNERDRLLIPNPNIDRYHLSLVKKVEDSFIEFLKRNEIKEIKVPQISLSPSLNRLSDYPKPGILFTGREKEIQEFQNTFNSFRIFAIEGLGGIGKTQFVAKCIEEIITDKKRIIWLNGSTQSNFDVFVESAGYGDVLRGEKKTDLSLYSGLKDLIEKDERIIFWDNYNDYNDESFSKFLSFAHQYLQKATIILITKTEPTIIGITSLSIVRLEGLSKDAIEYAKKLKNSNTRYISISDSDLKKICTGVEGHPLAIEFSLWLMSYGKSADDIMLHMPEFSGLKKVEEFSKRLFLDIFNHSNTSDEERECFLKCSVFKERIKEEEIKFLYDGKDIFYLLVGLMDKLLITSKDGFYEIHPLVRSFSYEKLSNKLNINKKAAECFLAQRIESLNPSLEEKIFYHLCEAEEWEIIANSIELIGRNFIQQGQLGLINEFINKLLTLNIKRPIFDILIGDFTQIKGEWDKAIVYFENASKNTQSNKIKAEGMIKYGEILFRRGDNKESLEHFENAYEFSKANALNKEEARALNDIGLVNYDFDNLDIANEKFNAALKIRKDINDIEGIGASYNNLANIFNKRKQYNKALEYYDKAITIAESMGNKIELIIYFLNIVNTLRIQEKLNESYIKTLQAIKICEEIGDKAGLSFGLNNIGLIFISQGKFKEGFSKFIDSLKVKEEIGDKRGMATLFNNIGLSYYEVKNYEKALYNYFKAYAMCQQIGNKAEQKSILNSIYSIKENIGKAKFRELIDLAYSELDSESQKLIIMNEFYDEPIVREFPKVGRNDVCPCGSGKKYKLCHGKS